MRPSSHPLLVQLARVWRLSGRWLPNGWLDAIRQLALFAGAYYLYRLVRGFVDGQAGLAFENARDLVDFERALGPLLRAGPAGAGRAARTGSSTFANWMYVNSHFVITTTFLIWLYLARNDAFYFVRNMFMVAMGLALVGYMVFPTAPPRFLPEWGFIDTSPTTSAMNAEHERERALQPVRRGAEHARGVLADDRRAGAHAREAARAQGALGALPARRDVRRDRHRQPLLDRRRAGRAGRRALRLGRLLRLARARPRLGLAPRRGRPA